MKADQKNPENREELRRKLMLLTADGGSTSSPSLSHEHPLGGLLRGAFGRFAAVGCATYCSPGTWLHC